LHKQLVELRACVRPLRRLLDAVRVIGEVRKTPAMRVLVAMRVELTQQRVDRKRLTDRYPKKLADDRSPLTSQKC
jgi:hypothetical protein